MPTDERRRSPRVDKNIPLKISSDALDIVTESKNLSCTGAYCIVNKSLDPMTKLRIQLLLPCRQKSKTVIKKISCCGVVVRSQADKEGKHFSIAIYFNDILEKDKKIITEYIGSALKRKC